MTRVGVYGIDSFSRSHAAGPCEASRLSRHVFIPAAVPKFYAVLLSGSMKRPHADAAWPGQGSVWSGLKTFQRSRSSTFEHGLPKQSATQSLVDAGMGRGCVFRSCALCEHNIEGVSTFCPQCDDGPFRESFAEFHARHNDVSPLTPALSPTHKGGERGQREATRRCHVPRSR